MIVNQKAAKRPTYSYRTVSARFREIQIPTISIPIPRREIPSTEKARRYEEAKADRTKVRALLCKPTRHLHVVAVSPT